MNPTTEQSRALELFLTDDDLVIEAGAGTGKTSTLRLLAESTTRRGQYVAFNKAIVTEAEQKFPSNVKCSTAHSLAYRALGRTYGPRLRSSKRMKSWELAKLLGVRDITFPDGKRAPGSFLAGLVLKGITRFCQSADDAPSGQHVPYVPGVEDEPGAFTNNAILRDALVAPMRRAWTDLTDPRGVLPYKHEHYLKAWQLQGPTIDADFILFDEAQDANPVMAAIVAAQTCQKVYVGDTQQQIYAWTGAVNAMEAMTGNRCYLTQSFRFGPAVADMANTILSWLDAPLRLSGLDSIASTVTLDPCDVTSEPDALLCRTNATAVTHVMAALAAGRKPHMVGGGGDVVAFARAAMSLMGGRRTEHPELACFESWSEVVEYVQQDENGEDLALMVNLINRFGPGAIVDALDGMTSESDADVVVSTAHKSKGREWDRVALAGDYATKAKVPADIGPDEMRLLYVAVTRAKLHLDVSAVGLLAGEE